MKKRTKILIALYVAVVVLNVGAWIAPTLSTTFGVANWCDLYAEHVNPVIVNVWARAMNLVNFSLGEVLVVLGIVLAVIFVVMTVVRVVTAIVSRRFERKRCGVDVNGDTSNDEDKFVASVITDVQDRKKRNTFKHIYKNYSTFLAWVLAILCIIMTLNCTIYYHCSALEVGDESSDRDYTLAELETLRDYIVEKCNYYSEIMDRDEDGYIIYDGDIQEAARNALQNISDTYPRLSGYYPDVKHMFFSNLMSQSYMAGYYFPFSMEANCNGNMYIMNYAACYTHELAHLHGYIYEDEANFIAYLACVESDDPFVAYSGYLSVLNRVNNAYYKSLKANPGAEASTVTISEQVKEDDVFLLEETWEEVEATAIVSTETVEKASDTFVETSLNLNGVSDGMASYNRVVELLLKYYDGVGY